MIPSSTPQYHTFLRVSTPSPRSPYLFSVSLWVFTLWLACVSSITVVEDDLTYVSNWFNRHIYLSLLLIRSVSVQRRDRCTGMQQETQFPHL